MFTGIIEATGRVVRRGREGSRTVLTVSCPEWRGRLAAGNSVAVDGVCLTVTRLAGERISMDLGAETLQRTTLGGTRPGRRVNLEQPLRMGDRLGGHLVQGHVDGVVRVARVETAAGGRRVLMEMPEPFRPYLIEKGSVAVNGVSLTVAELGDREFGVFLVPYTLQSTTLDDLRPGDEVNVELDLMGKYVARWLAETGRIAPGDVLSEGSEGGAGTAAGRWAPTRGSGDS
jgi:riboflavin synthase